MGYGHRVGDAELLAQLRRVAELVEGPVTTKLVDRHLEGEGASSATIRRRFGSWWDALQRAGLADRYPRLGPTELRFQPGRGMTRDQIVAELVRVAAATGRRTVTEGDLRRHSSVVRRHLVRARFGSMRAAMVAAGLSPNDRGSRWSNEQLMDNVAALWVHYGRRPTRLELDRPPSRMSEKVYRRQFGSSAAAIEAGRPGSRLMV